MKNLTRWTSTILGVLFLTGCDTPVAGPTVPSAGVTTSQIIAEPGCSQTSVGFTPLTDGGVSPYRGVPLGLYPGGNNQMPDGHLSAGMDLASSTKPLNALGAPDPDGRYALISVGMSNTTQEFSEFIAMSPSPNWRLSLVDGAQSGQTAADWADPGCACWSILDDRIRTAGLTNAQVIAAWVKLANQNPSGEWPIPMRALQRDTEAVVRLLGSRFPNLRLAYLSSRIYGGYATTTTNPEPYAYQGGFAVRGVIEHQLNGQLPFTGASRVAPWVAWGPYLWADGLRARSDGLTWSCSDFVSDGTHPSASGRQKVAELLARFFKNDLTTRQWFMASVGGVSRTD